MTTTATHGDVTIIWPQLEDADEFAMEHALVVRRYSDSLSIEQNGRSVSIPWYALREVMKAMREAQKAREAAQP